MFFDIVLIRCIALTQQFQKIWILIEELTFLSEIKRIHWSYFDMICDFKVKYEII